MGWMAELAGENSHKGQVVVTNANGVSTTFVDVEKAEEACGKLKGKLAYFRGAFFEKGASRPERKTAAQAQTKPEPKPKPKPKTEKTDEPLKRRRRVSTDTTDGD